VAVSGDEAEATCAASFGDPRTSPGHPRTLMLEREDGAWVIRSTTD
jgi:hypothetical protein